MKTTIKNIMIITGFAALAVQMMAKEAIDPDEVSLKEQFVCVDKHDKLQLFAQLQIVPDEGALDSGTATVLFQGQLHSGTFHKIDLNTRTGSVGNLDISVQTLSSTFSPLLLGTVYNVNDVFPGDQLQVYKGSITTPSGPRLESHQIPVTCKLLNFSDFGLH